MALLSILQYPDERLHRVATEVKQITPEIVKIVNNMAETMYASKGIGLAANQVNIFQRIIVIDVSEDHNNLMVVINPEIIQSVGEHCGEEGCLSVPGFYEPVSRHASVTVRYTNLDSEPQKIHAEGLLAICLQHEIDHLNGKVFVQHLSLLKQQRIRSKILKQRQEKNIDDD